MVILTHIFDKKHVEKVKKLDDCLILVAHIRERALAGPNLLKLEKDI